jgi:hypothetical protein
MGLRPENGAVAVLGGGVENAVRWIGSETSCPKFMRRGPLGTTHQKGLDCRATLHQMGEVAARGFIFEHSNSRG